MATETPTPKLVSPPVAAKMLGIGERTLWTLRNTGQIPFVKIGKSVRFPVAALDQWIESKQQLSGE